MIKAERGAIFREVFGNPWPGEAELFFKSDRTREERRIISVYFRSANNEGKSLLQMYTALCDLDVGLEPSVQREAAAIFLNAMLPDMANLETPSSVITELVRHADILPGLPVLGIEQVAEIISDCRTGCLVRGIDTSLRSHVELAQFTTTHEQAMSFYISAVLRDDLKAIDHLNALPAMRELVSDSDIREICVAVDRYPDVFSSEASAYFEKIPSLSNVRDRYIAPMPVSAYLKNLKTAIKKGSLQALEYCFDASLSLRCGPALITEILNMYEPENRTPTEKQTNQMVKACAIKLIQAGLDAYPAYLETVHGRLGALDFIDSPPNRCEIMNHCLATRKEGEQDLTVFLMMFTPKELAAHERGQELLERLHKFTNDPQLLQFMTSLQYVGKAFSNDLGL